MGGHPDMLDNGGLFLAASVSGQSLRDPTSIPAYYRLTAIFRMILRLGIWTAIVFIEASRPLFRCPGAAGGDTPYRVAAYWGGWVVPFGICCELGCGHWLADQYGQAK